jgi:hypothetical protein
MAFAICDRAGRCQGCQMVCFQTKDPNFGYISEGLRMENVVIFYDQLGYFMAIWHNVWQFGIGCGRLVYFLDQEKSGNPVNGFSHNWILFTRFCKTEFSHNPKISKFKTILINLIN